MTSSDSIVAELEMFRSDVEFARGHAHLYNEFDGILARVACFRSEAGALDAGLASAILATVDLLVRENSAGRRPWAGEWETYFAKCMEDAGKLLGEFASFENYGAFCPPGYCNRFLDAFKHMDHHDRDCEEREPRWSQHFARLASLAAEMFSLTADKEAYIEEKLLEHDNDAVFTRLLTGYAKSAKSKVREILQGYLEDEETWVRRLARELIGKYFTA